MTETPEPVELLADLVAAASEGHTRRTLLWRVAQVLARWLPLRSVELGEQVDGELVLLTAKPGEAAVTSTRQPVGQPAAAHPVRTPSTGRKPRSDTPRRVVVPLGEATPTTLSLTLHLDAAQRADLLTPSLLAALGRVMLHLLRGQEVTQRVAELSRRAHTENRELRDQRRQSEPERTLVARGPAMQEALARLEAVARFDTPVLLTGESGTGKELLAQRLHRLSPRGQRALIAINCGALPPQLVESALFGHEAGAFTGASKRHRGVFERADRGTLFLDEIGELPLAVQVKLLRALQSQEFERVGGEEKVRVDVRVIAATHRALEQMVEAGNFRRALFYRLGGRQSSRVISPPTRAGDHAIRSASYVRNARHHPLRDLRTITPTHGREMRPLRSYAGHATRLERAAG